MLVNTMANSINAYKVQFKQEDVGVFRGLFPMVLTEYHNAFYVYDMVMGNPPKNLELVQFKEDVKPKEEEKKSEAKPAEVKKPEETKAPATSKNTSLIANLPKIKPPPPKKEPAPTQKSSMLVEDSDEEDSKMKKVRNAEDVLLSKSQFNDDDPFDGKKKPEPKKFNKADLRAALALPESTKKKLNSMKKAEDGGKANSKQGVKPTMSAINNFKMIDPIVMEEEKKKQPPPPPPPLIQKLPVTIEDDEDDPDILFLKK